MNSPFHPADAQVACRRHAPHSALGVPRAFSLVEILIVVALLSVIVLGLMAMFGQTQRAFRTGLAQTDVLEAGRAATDLIGRELGQMRPSYQPGVTNFHTWIPPITPLLMALPGSTERRTNFPMDLFFLTSENRRWTATGFTVRDPKDVTARPQGGVGTLYRYTVDHLLPVNVGVQAGYFLHPAQTNFSRIADGVVHLRVRAFDTNGVWIRDELANNIGFNKSDVRWSTIVPDEIGLCALKSNAVPGAVEIELGFLETRTLERANSITDATARNNFLAQQAGRVHLFRQRIPIPTVDVRAYQ